MIISVVTDFDSQLGSWFGLAVLMGLAWGGRNSPAGAFSGFLRRIGFLSNTSTPAQGAASSHGGGGGLG